MANHPNRIYNSGSEKSDFRPTNLFSRVLAKE
jgi:hypothetical protein